MKTVAGEGKKARNFGPHPSGPHLWGPTLCGPKIQHPKIGQSRNWPKSKLAEVELAELEKKKKLAEVEIGGSRSRSGETCPSGDERSACGLFNKDTVDTKFDASLDTRFGHQLQS